MTSSVTIERLFEGRPLISPSDLWWESGVTFNSAALRLEPSESNLKALHALLGEVDFRNYPDGVVVLHYRARPKVDAGLPWTRSFVGVSVHHPDLTLIQRHSEPVVSPGGLEHGVDDQGVEDPRITWIDGKWWMVYCGVCLTGSTDPEHMWIGSVCTAWSEDLVHWNKCGPVVSASEFFAHPGDTEAISNKDGLFFPDRIDGKVMLLHRPMSGDMGTWGTSLACADQPNATFQDLGSIHKAAHFEGYERSWAGAGAVPIKIRDGVYLSIEHTGNYITERRRKYVLDAFIYDFNRWSCENPETLVAARLDSFMEPETDYEIRSPYHDSVANVVFTCGAYVYDGWIYLVYGGGDTYILAARIRLSELVDKVMDQSKVRLENAS